MAFSYCATAMARATSACFRLAALRPASNNGISTCGANVHAQVPALKSPLSSVLALPRLPVSEIFGKNAARAAAMLASAASSCCSAWRTSGRRTNTSEGRPAGSAGSPEAWASGRPCGRSAGGSVPMSSVSAFRSLAC